jgi:hypothetical protein
MEYHGIWDILVLYGYYKDIVWTCMEYHGILDIL